jgi:LPS-assembly lipoprotein
MRRDSIVGAGRSFKFKLEPMNIFYWQCMREGATSLVSRLPSLVFLFALALMLSACGFKLRGEANLPSSLQRVHVQIADPFSPLKRDLEAALKRAGATVEEESGDGIAEILLPTVSLAPVVRSVGVTAFVNEFSMIYHVELQVADTEGNALTTLQVIEHSREFTFDRTQAIGTGVEQDEIKKEMERDMVQAVMRKVEAAGRRPKPAALEP